MKLAVVLLNGKEHYAKLTDDEKLEILEGSLETGLKGTGQILLQSDLKILPPVKPSKIVCVGLNYTDHIEEIGLPRANEPVLFFKPPSSIIAHGEKIVLPSQSSRVDFEGELALVIKKTGKNIEESHAKDYILGYTCANDVTARDLQTPDSQWTIAKGFDTFLPIGPYINTDIDSRSLDIKTHLNGKLMQSSNTNMLLWGCNKLISYISSFMTLYAGDVILTGTPAGIGAMKDNDKVSVTIEGLGTLENLVTAL